MRPTCSSSSQRVVNVSTPSSVSSGDNVMLYDRTNHSSQLWNFEALSTGEYVIRSANNSSCVLTASSGNVCVKTYTGSDSQKWILESLDQKFTINYNANGGSGTAASKTVGYAGWASVSKNLFTRTGYTLSGWNIRRHSDNSWYVTGKGWVKESDIAKNNYTKKQYPADWSGYIDTSWTKGSAEGEEFTFYAVWTINTYKVKYDANGGSGAPSEQTKTFKVDLTLSSTKPTRQGYTFTGWNTKKDGSGTSYAAGAVYKTNAAVTLTCATALSSPSPIIRQHLTSRN